MVDVGGGLIGYFIITYVVLSVIGDMFKFNPIEKILEIITFGKSKRDKSGKTEDITDATPEDEFSILEVDVNTCNAYFKEKTTTEKQGYIINTENTPITIKNTIKIDRPFRVFMKGFSREITGFLLKPDYKLNPSAPEVKRFGDMKILKAFLAITKKHDDTLQKLIFILVAGLLIYVYKLSGNVTDSKDSINLLLQYHEIPIPT